jgi:holliday junction DNA helicase RuvA
MISSLNGSVTAVTSGAAEVDVSGVGYLVQAAPTTLFKLKLGQRIRLLTHMVVREDSMTLYGFTDAEERELFRCLIGVTGVGPKLALAVIGHLKPDALRRAVASGDVALLTTVPGVGTRSAQRMVLELKDLLGNLESGFSPGTSNLAEVREALLGLGYGPAEVAPVLDSVAAENAEVEEMVKSALRALSRV